MGIVPPSAPLPMPITEGYIQSGAGEVDFAMCATMTTTTEVGRFNIEDGWLEPGMVFHGHPGDYIEKVRDAPRIFWLPATARTPDYAHHARRIQQLDRKNGDHDVRYTYVRPPLRACNRVSAAIFGTAGKTIGRLGWYCGKVCSHLRLLSFRKGD